jgi:non-ribosomal peptide synthase protein (TIGR01720 family)
MEQNAQYAKGAALEQELAYWQNLESKDTNPLPVEHKDGTNLFLNSKTSFFTLSQEETSFIQSARNGCNKVEINALLLAALGKSLQKVFGMNRIKVSMEGHGREEIIEGIDITRTIGWFTSIYPAVLDMQEGEDVELMNLLHINESLKSIPSKGMGYGLIKYLSPYELPASVPAGINFNYLGEISRSHKAGEDILYELSDMPFGTVINNYLVRNIELDFFGQIVDSELTLGITYSDQRYETATIDTIIQHCKDQLLRFSKQLHGLKIPIMLTNDFAYKNLNSSHIEEQEREYGKQEDILQ